MKARHVVGGILMLIGAAGIFSQLFRGTPSAIVFGGCLLILLFGALWATSREEGGSN